MLFVALAGWWGGLTFYGLVVIPEGTEQLGSLAQGLVTQRVTQTLNLIGVVVAVLLFVELLRSATRILWAAWFLFVVCQITLFIIHGRLSTMLEPGMEAVVDHGRFYSVHRLYLLASAIQWFLGLGFLKFIAQQRDISVPKVHRR